MGGGVLECGADRRIPKERQGAEMPTRKVVVPGQRGVLLYVAGLLLFGGCYTTPPERSDASHSPAPLRMPPPDEPGCSDCYEDSLTGGKIFSMYCASCHNARPLSERPFSSFKNVAAHMRVRANLTGKEYAKLVAWLRRWHDVPPPDQADPSSPKRFFFGQPIPELQKQQPRTGVDPVAGPRAGATDEASPGQPPPGNGPREAR